GGACRRLLDRPERRNVFAAAVTLLWGVAVLAIPAASTGCRPLPVLLATIRPGIAGLIAAFGFLALVGSLPEGPLSTIAALIGALLTYSLFLIVFDRKQLRDDWAAAHGLWRFGRQPNPA